MPIPSWRATEGGFPAGTIFAPPASMDFEEAYKLASRVLVRLADGQLGKIVVFRLSTECVDVLLPSGRYRTVPSARLDLRDGVMVEVPA